MILLDTDHLSELRFPEGQKHATLRQRMDKAAGETFATTIVNVEEQMRGWLAFMKRAPNVGAQIEVYERLRKMLEFFEEWEIIDLDSRAVQEYRRLKKEKVRIGSQDLKIASIAVANEALLLSANLRDFRKVPGLRVECWIE